MSDELHSLEEDILDCEDDVQTIETTNMVVYGFKNNFYCYRIVEK